MRSAFWVHVVSLFSLLVSTIYPKSYNLIQFAANPKSQKSELVLPGFVLPYDKDETVYWTGGPHEYKNKTRDGKYPTGHGSGLDFQEKNKKNFNVLAMADGTIIQADTSCHKEFGCQVVIRHFTGNSVLIYGHLKEGTITNKEGDRVSQGEILGKAGMSGGTENVHLHIELRDGSKTCVDNNNCLFGNPIGWDDLHDFVDGYKIGGYIVDGEGLESFNYDGSAVKGEISVFDQFRFLDQPGNNPRIAIARVHSNFYCDVNKTNDCEINSDPNALSGTQFSVHGLFSIPNKSMSSVNSLAIDQSISNKGILISSNNANWPSSILTNDASTFISDISCPDGSILSPGQSSTKTWRLQNTGSTTWGSGYQLAFLRGDRMGAPASINVPATSPGQTVDMSVPITALSSPGSYKGYWQLRNPQGTYFGPEIWVNINVKAASAHITILETDPASPANTNKVRIHARADDFPNLRAMRIKVDGVIIGEIGAPEIWAEWSTEGYANGVHAIVVEAADNTDLNWVRPEVRGLEYTLQGNTASSNHAPNPPTLTNPGEWAVYQGTGGITLSAQANGDPDGDPVNQYYFEIYNSHDTPNSGWINSNSWNPPGLSIYGYQWHVKVRDNRGAESGWSETRHFTVNDPNPQIYSFSSQTCRPSWNQGDPDKICFCASTNAGTLQLHLNSATDGSENGTWKIINELGTSNYSCNLDSDSPPTLDPKELTSGTHRVRLYARMNDGWANAKTQDITISVGNLRPNPPMANTLTNGAYTNSQDITLGWNATQRTSSYRVEVSTDAGFASHLVDQTVSSSQTTLNVHLDTAYNTVYWKVTANGPYGSSSVTNMFHVDITPPDTSISVASSTVYEDNFAVNWAGSDSGSGFQWYSIQTLDQSRPESEWQDWQVNTVQTAAIFKGLAGHTYLIRVRGIDQAGNWQDWPSANGTRQVLVKIDPASRPPDPWWNASYVYKRSLTILNNDGDWMPPHYPVHIRFTSSTTPTAAEIYNASQSTPKGNDLRVIYNNTTELNRFVQRFSSDQIDIWFPLQNGLGGSSSDTTSYHLYYGNASAGAPPANVNAVFLPVTDSNTMGLWHFQEGSGGSVIDSSGRGHNGTFYAPGWIDGQAGWAGLFNGAGSYVDAGNSNDFNLVTGPMTIEAWIYLTSRGNFPHIVSKWGQDGSYFLRLLDGRTPHFSSRSGGELSGGDLALNQWYHIATTYDGSSTMRLYINGQQQTVKTGVVDGILTAHRLFIGWAEQGYDGGYFPGYIQHVRVSNVERSDFSYARIDVQPSVSAGIQQVPPATGQADLSILSLTTYPNSSGGILVEAVVKNLGTVSTTNGFYTDLYINHLPSGAGDYTGSLQFWVNDPIPAGSTATLTTVITDLSQIGLAASVPGEEKRGTLYVQTDSTGALTETDKANNITSDTEICVVTADAFERDETFSTANLLDSTQQHNFDRPNDEDWVKFIANQGHTYTIRTSNLGPIADTYMYLYGPDGMTLLQSNDDYEDTLASQIKWFALKDGIYYLQVKQWNPSMSGCGSGFTIEIDDHHRPIYLPVIKP